MQGEQRVLRRHLTRSRRNIALATAIAALSTLSTASAATAGGGPVAPVPPEDDVAEWFDEVDPAMVVDKSADCMAGATDTVFYRGDRIVMRPTTVMTDGAVRTAVNNALNGIYGTPRRRGPRRWSGSSSRSRPRARRSSRCSRCRSSPRSDGEPHDVVDLARSLRHEPGIQSAPDYGLITHRRHTASSGRRAIRRPITGLTPPRRTSDWSGFRSEPGSRSRSTTSGSRPCARRVAERHPALLASTTS